MSAHIGIVTVPGRGHYVVSASLGGIEVERTVEEHKTTLQPVEALNLAMLLTRAVSECRHMRADEGTVGELVEALMWCSGAADFQEGGVAHEGFEKHVRPLINAWRLSRAGGSKK